MKRFLAICAVAALAAANANALTLKKGQVIGGDGGVYDGASPEQIEVYINRAKEGGDAAGIAGPNVFVIVEDDITFVPVVDLQGQSKDSQLNMIGDAVVETVSGSDALSFEQLQELQEVSEMTGLPIDQVLKVDAALSGLDAELAETLTQEIQTLVEEGALEEVQAFLSSDVIIENLDIIADVTQQIEQQLADGLADDIDGFDICAANYDEATCSAIEAEFEALEGGGE